MTWPYALSWLTMLLPLGGALVSFVAETPRRAAHACVVATGLAFAVGLAVLGFRLAHYQTSGQPYESLLTFMVMHPDETQLFPSDFHPQFGVRVDNLSLTFGALAAFLSLMAQVHATVVLRGDAAYRRFFWVVGILTGGVLGAIFSPNLFQSWLAAGLATSATLLLGLHWWQRERSAESATRSFLTLLAADLAMLFVLVFTIAKLGEYAGTQSPPAGEDVSDPYSYLMFGPAVSAAQSGLVLGTGTRSLTLLSLIVIAVALIRSAQAPVTGWLTSLVEAPLPALALLGSAPLLIGVVLLARTYPLLLATPHMLTLLALVAAASAVVLAVATLLARDIYRIALLASAAQLGLALAALGMGGFSPGLFATFVGAPAGLLIVLVAGNLVRVYRTRLITEMGGAFRRVRRTSTALAVWAVAVAGGDLAGYHVLSAVFRDQPPGAAPVSAAGRDAVAALVIIAMTVLAVAAFRVVWTVGAGEPVRRRGFVVERIAEVEPRLRRLLVPAMLAVLVAALCGIPGVTSFDSGRTHVPGLTFSHWVYFGTIRQQLAVSGPALAVDLVLVAVGAGFGAFAFSSPARGDVLARLGALGRIPWGVLARPVAGLAVTTGTLLERADSTVLTPLLEAPAAGLDLASGAAQRLRTSRAATAAAVALLAVIVAAGLAALAAAGHLPGVHTR